MWNWAYKRRLNKHVQRFCGHKDKGKSSSNECYWNQAQIMSKLSEKKYKILNSFKNQERDKFNFDKEMMYSKIFDINEKLEQK